jgi:uncharacterized membrane protein
VIFLMLSGHYPLAFGTEYSWLIAALVFLMGVTIRHYFNTIHARAGNPIWTWPATVAIFLVIVWLSTLPGQTAGQETAALTPREERLIAAEGFAEAHDAVIGYCSMCHAREPFWQGIRVAPNGVVLETEADIARNARDIYLQSGISHAMPPANITYMEPEDRAAIVRWYRSAGL